MKGNPLLRPGAQSPQERSAAKLSPFLSYEEAYGPGRTPFTTERSALCDGVTYQPGQGCYYYALAASYRTVYGGGMTFSVHRPAYVRLGGAGHTLAELALQGGANNGDIVEVGWNVSTDQYGDADPHLFVFHWLGGDGTCYDACGWQQMSRVFYPGQNLSAFIGRDLSVGYRLHDGDWWVWVDNEWLGYFPGALWSNPFRQAALTQWFGEVSADNGIPPRTHMGTGAFPVEASAARMSYLCSILENEGPCVLSDQHFINVNPPQAARYYGIEDLGASAVRYGGPGQ
jgi:hypothetical protein